MLCGETNGTVSTDYWEALAKTEDGGFRKSERKSREAKAASVGDDRIEEFKN